jgi:prophage antirepressor-like protein
MRHFASCFCVHYKYQDNKMEVAMEIDTVSAPETPLDFIYNERQIRVYIKNNEPWFVGKDVCEVLEVKNSSDALSRLDCDEKDEIGSTDSVGRAVYGVELTSLCN